MGQLCLRAAHSGAGALRDGLPVLQGGGCRRLRPGERQLRHHRRAPHIHERDGVRRAVVDHDSAAQELRKADESQSMPDALGPAPGAGVSCAVSGRKKKKQCKEKPAGNCVFLKKGKQCLATPQNGGACSSYGKKKLCKRVGGCMWSGSKKKGSCAQV